MTEGTEGSGLTNRRLPHYGAAGSAAVDGSGGVGGAGGSYNVEDSTIAQLQSLTEEYLERIETVDHS